MKYLPLLLFMALNFSLIAQRTARFSDSLTLNSQRTWIQVNGSSFTKIGDNCNYGMEMTFFKRGNKVKVMKCEKGEWVKSNYYFEVVTEGGEHFVKFYKKGSFLWLFETREEVTDFKIEIQMIADQNRSFTTELNYFSLFSKMTFVLRSKSIP